MQCYHDNCVSVYLMGMQFVRTRKIIEKNPAHFIYLTSSHITKLLEDSANDEAAGTHTGV